MKKYDRGLVLLSCGIDFDKKKGIWVPDYLSDMRTRATAIHYRNNLEGGQRSLIFICGGKCRRYDAPALSSVLSDYAFKLGVEKDDIVEESMSNTTLRNAKHVLPNIASHNLLENLEIITNDFHIHKARLCFEIYGKKYGLKEFKVLAAEDILRESSVEEQAQVEAYLASDKAKFAYARARFTSSILRKNPFLGRLFLQIAADIQQAICFGRRL